MTRDKKGFLFGGLYSCLAFAMCLIMGLSSAHAKIEFINHPSNVFRNVFDKRCSIVNIHSLYKAEDGKTLHQQGVGWITYSDNYYGVITPYHVVVNAERVIAECRGQYFLLESPTIDAEKDIAHLYFTEADIDRMKEHLIAIVYALKPSEQAFKNELMPANPAHKLLYLNFPRTNLDNDLFGLMLGMGNFGVAGAINPETNTATAIMSPIRTSIVQPLIDSDQSFIKNLIRVENMGIRPGQSGSALFGIPDNYLMYSSQNETSTLSTPIEMIPKVLFGMITKTRLNGAETVALSIGDIYDFIETRVMTAHDKIGSRDLRVNYETIRDAKGEQLRSAISFHVDGKAEESARAYEFCSGEYKNSAESGFTENKKLLALYTNSKSSDQDKNTLEGLYNNLSNIAFSYKTRHKERGDLQVAGGGEYGEGGNGFLSPKSEFLTSQRPIGQFDQSFKFNALKTVPSFGLYLAHNSCPNRGLLIVDDKGKKLIHTVKLPAQKTPTRMTSFEDLRHFNKKYGVTTLSLLQKYGQTDNKPFFTKELSDSETLSIPLLTAQTINSDNGAWNANDRQYLKQKLLIRPESTLPVADALEVSNKSLKLAINLAPFKKLARTDFQDRLQLQYANNQWKASIAIGLSCRMEFEPKFFKQVNPYYVEYDDGKNILTLDLNSHDRFIAVNLQKSSCPELKDLALAEIEVYLIREMSAVIGTTRTALIPKPLDFKFLKEKYLLPAGVTK